MCVKQTEEEWLITLREYHIEVRETCELKEKSDCSMNDAFDKKCSEHTRRQNMKKYHKFKINQNIET